MYLNKCNMHKAIMKSKWFNFDYLIIATMSLFLTVGGMNASENGINTTGNLTVTVEGLKSDNGCVIIKLYNSKETYSAKCAKAFIEQSATIKNRKAEAIFNYLSPGEFAIKVYHDENSNGIHDKNFIGIPKEDYAFSNNASGTMGQPDYEKAKFIFKIPMTMIINISKI
jgi:uncharacterized protein (DUF2141 family)